VIDATNDGFSVSIDGAASGALTVAHGTYTPAQLASALQTAINGSTVLTAAGAGVAVTLNSGNLVIASKNYGTLSSVTSIAGSALSALGYTGAEGGTGTDVAGNFVRNGMTYTAIGSGQLLTATAGTAADSLKILYTGTPAQAAANSSATLNYSKGYASTLYEFATTMLDPSGSIAGRTTGLNASIADIGKQRDAINRRLTQVEANYRAQFTALDSMIASLNQTSSFLTQQLANLPTTSSK
jgi:flagellar hook-associated protein 2